MPRARLTDPETSREAAESVTHVRESQEAILEVLRVMGSGSDTKIYAMLGQPWTTYKRKQSESGARTRRKELVDAGLVRDSGLRATTPSGRKTIIWELVPTPDL
jgi:hypothetical protein